MDYQQVRDHLQVLNLRVASFEQELSRAFENAKAADDRIKTLQENVETIKNYRQERTQEIEARFENERNECNTQIKLAEDVLAKKKEERQTLLSYLKGLKFDEQSLDELRDFDWNALQRLAENLHKPDASLLERHQQAEELNNAIETAKQRMQDLYEVISSTSVVRDRLASSLGSFSSQQNEWNEIRTIQERRIDKTQADSERLYTLIRQCVATNKPMSEYITRNIQAKCRSFVHSESTHELLDGLLRFRSRQERIIKLLQHKEHKMSGETNKLEVAKDQTHDQVRFYLEILGARRAQHVNNASGGRNQRCSSSIATITTTNNKQR